MQPHYGPAAPYAFPYGPSASEPSTAASTTSSFLFPPEQHSGSLGDHSSLQPQRTTQGIFQELHDYTHGSSNTSGVPSMPNGQMYSPVALDQPPARAMAVPHLRASNDHRGFFVEVPGVAQYELWWEDLINFLLDPDSTKHLRESHVMRKTVDFIRDQNRHRSASSHTAANSSSPSTWSPDAAYALPNAVVGGFDALSFSAPASEETVNLSSATNLYSRPLSTASASSYQSINQHRASNNFITPLQRAFLPPSAPPPTCSLPPPPSLTPPEPPATIPVESSPSTWQSEPQVTRHPSSHRETARTRTQPYPNPRPASVYSNHSSTHSIHSVHSAHSTRSSSQSHRTASTSSDYDRASSVPSGPRPPRALNGSTEVYVWSSQANQLFRVTPGVDPSMMLGGGTNGNKGEIITFPPGSYYKVVKEDLEILPSDNKGINDWIRGQRCVSDCRFRFERKRPATIRAHFISCKLRLNLRTDPIRRICQLQTEAQRRFKTPSIGLGGTLAGLSTSWSSLSRSHQGDTSSVSGSLTDLDTDDGTDSIYEDPEIEEDGEAQWASLPQQTPEEASEQALQAFLASPTTNKRSSDWAPWLADFGLQEPTDMHDAGQQVGPTQSMYHEQQKASDSFLSMDEE